MCYTKLTEALVYLKHITNHIQARAVLGITPIPLYRKLVPLEVKQGWLREREVLVLFLT